MKRFAELGLLSLLLAASWACSGDSARSQAESAAGAHAPVVAQAPRPELEAARPSTEQQVAAPPTLLVTDPAVLRALEARGLALVSVLRGSNADGEFNAELDNHALAALPAFEPVREVLVREAERVKQRDPQAGVEVARFSHRLFDTRFLSSASARFTLAAVVSRPDRAPFVASSCGETRLIYRLGYGSGELASKLPMTLGIEFGVPRPPQGCRALAARWLETPGLSPDERAARLRSDTGPLAPAATELTSRSARVVVNLQLVRWPSTVRPDLGGHAEYLLRSFRLDDRGRLAPEPLENTIDGARLRARPALRQALLTWLSAPEQRAALDAGTATLPREFLAERAVSVTPRGLARGHNRPYSRLLRASDLRHLDYAPNRYVRSPEALLRRLDQLSCPGCHEARSVAGFHLLGEDGPDVPVENALGIAFSPHVSEDAARRAAVAHDMLSGAEVDFSAPFAERADLSRGPSGAHCSLGRDPSFADWSCDSGLRCSDEETPAGEPVGQCVPVSRSVGEGCELGAVKSSVNPERERMGAVALARCEAGSVCNRSAVGFPGGMCTADCGASGAVCGGIAILDSFNACLGRGDSFLSCIRGNVQPAGLRGCDERRPCRDDYVCARTPNGGACLPPYFVFQLRVDGHRAR